jgi:ATP-binding cassette subfamily F protein uup
LPPATGSVWSAATGSGKSILLRIAAGLVQPDAGERFAQPGTTIQYLPQEPDLAGFTTTLAYVEAGFDAAAADGDHRALYLLKELGLSARSRKTRSVRLREAEKSPHQDARS